MFRGSGYRLSVWVTGQDDHSVQLRDRGYLPETACDVEAISPSIAAHAIRLYSRPGALVVDPECGAGIVPTEAVRAGRHAVGLTADSTWWETARGNLTAAKRGGAWPDGTVLDTGSDRRSTVRMAGIRRRADLVVTSIRMATMSRSLGPDSDFDHTVRQWTELMRPGGRVAVILQPYRTADGTLVDVPNAVLRAATAMGLVPVDRCVALTAQLRGSRVVPHTTTRGSTDSGGAPIAVVAHHTVLVFQAPEVAEASQSVWDAVRTRTDLPVACGPQECA